MLTQLDTLPAGLLEATAAQLGEVLPGPALIHLPGRRTPPLFVSVLLHGNEDTGWLAAQSVLKKYAAAELARGAFDLGRRIGPGGPGAKHQFLIEQRRGVPKCGREHLLEPAVARQAQDVMHVGLRLDPRHDRLPAKAAVGAHHDAHVSAETRANGGDDLLERLERAIRAVAIGRA